MAFFFDNIISIVVGLLIVGYVYRAFANHKTIDQRMEETINDPNYDPMANDPVEKAYRKRKADSEAERD